MGVGEERMPGAIAWAGLVSVTRAVSMSHPVLCMQQEGALTGRVKH